MGDSAKKSPLVAVDTNVLLDRANDDELVLDVLDTLRRRIPAALFIVTPIVIEEIVLKTERGDTPADQRLARRVLASLIQPWGFQPVNFMPEGRGIVSEIASRLRREKLIPDTEMNESLLVAEAALV